MFWCMQFWSGILNTAILTKHTVIDAVFLWKEMFFSSQLFRCLNLILFCNVTEYLTLLKAWFPIAWRISQLYLVWFHCVRNILWGFGFFEIYSISVTQNITSFGIGHLYLRRLSSLSLLSVGPYVWQSDLFFNC